MKILLVNPPIYDFSAYDFWLRPYGLLKVGGYLRGAADLQLFDFLDRMHPSLEDQKLPTDSWGRGKYTATKVGKPDMFSHIPRIYRRYGISEQDFRAFLVAQSPFEAVLIQTNMTYWYQGVQEVLRTVNELQPKALTVLGGTYATLCLDHARSLGADLVIDGCDLRQLWDALNLEPDESQTPFWEGYVNNEVGVLKLASGCPFRCTYCSVPKVAPSFEVFSPDQSWQAFQFLKALDIKNIAFYDDALLFRSDEVLAPFLTRVLEDGYEGAFHTPNALNARFLSAEMARLMVEAGFRLFYLGYESNASSWQRSTGDKVSSSELDQAVDHLLMAGAKPGHITAYLIVGHPETEAQEIERSMRAVHDLGIRIMLSEYSPIPGTLDGEKCRQWVDLDEPLFHNKSAFSISYLGKERLQQLKDLSSKLNSGLPR